jgi:outer membrane protein assembly factor BamB
MKRFSKLAWFAVATFVAVAAVVGLRGRLIAGEKIGATFDPTKATADEIAKLKVGPKDWPMWFGSPYRNNTPDGKNIPVKWNIETGENILWKAALGSQSYGNPVIANGKVYVGTNNGNGYVKRYPRQLDLGCLVCFSDKNGSFLWQYSCEKLPSGRVHDWPEQGICCSPFVDGDRGWFVTSRGTVVCFDAEGFYDGEDDGPVVGEYAKQFELMKNDDAAIDKVGPALKALAEGKLDAATIEAFNKAGVELKEGASLTTVAPGKTWALDAEIQGKSRKLRLNAEPTKLVGWMQTTVDDKHEADVIWELDMMGDLKISQHNMCSCSIACLGDLLFIVTGNGVDESHINIPAPEAPSFIAVDRNTGKTLWTDKSPGVNILHGQWSSCAYGELGGVMQVLMPGGDGWLYSFKADKGVDGKPELLWKFDCNPKESLYVLGAKADRNHLIGTPVIYDGLVYIAVGEDPEHGEGLGHLWCIDPKKRGDVSTHQVFNKADPSTPVPHRRLIACEAEKGEFVKANPGTAAVWHYGYPMTKAEATVFEEKNKDNLLNPDFQMTQMHRTLGSVTIKNDILAVMDFSGYAHALDAKTGAHLWSHDMMSASWSSPLIVDDKIYICDEDGKVAIFALAREKKQLNSEEITMGKSVYTSPVVANDTLYVANKSFLFAIKEGAMLKQQPAEGTKSAEGNN